MVTTHFITPAAFLRPQCPPGKNCQLRANPARTPEPSTYNRHYSIESDSILHKALHGGPFKLTAQHVFWRRGSLLFRLKPNLFLPHLQHGSENKGLDDHPKLQTNRLPPSCPWLASYWLTLSLEGDMGNTAEEVTSTPCSPSRQVTAPAAPSRSPTQRHPG